MFIRSARYNMVFPPFENIQSISSELDSRLLAYFQPFQHVPIPDVVPMEIPRLVTSSHHGHSNLFISQNNAQLSTQYDKSFEENWVECLEYIRTRANVIFQSISEKIADHCMFSGLTMELMFDSQSESVPVEMIKSKFLNYRGNLAPHDIEYKITFIIDTDFYVNITFRNLRIYEAPVQENVIPSLTELKEVSEHLGITIDINDRHSYHFKKGYSSSLEQLSKIFKITSNLLSGQLKKIMDEGVFEL